MWLSRRSVLAGVAVGLASGLAGCGAADPGPAALRAALSDTLRVSRDGAVLRVRTTDAFGHDVLVCEAGHRFSLALPALDATTTELVPRETVTFAARAAGSADDYATVATYTVPFPDGGETPVRPTADVSLTPRADGSVAIRLESLGRDSAVRVSYPDGRPDDLLLWPGHRTVATDVPAGPIRIYASRGTAERLVETRRVG